MKFWVLSKAIVVFAAMFGVAVSYASDHEELTNNNGQSVHHRSGKLTIASNLLCPYICREDDRYYGYFVDIIDKSLNIYDITVDYHLVDCDSDGLLEMLKDGKYDAVMSIGEISTTLKPVQDLTESISFGLYTMQDKDVVFDSMSALYGKKILLDPSNIPTTLSHYFAINYLNNPSWFILADQNDGVDSAINKLFANVADIYVQDMRVVKYYLQNHDVADFLQQIASIKDNQPVVYVAFSRQKKDADKYIRYIERALSLMKSTGEYNNLRKKYNMDI